MEENQIRFSSMYLLAESESKASFFHSELVHMSNENVRP